MRLPPNLGARNEKVRPVPSICDIFRDDWLHVYSAVRHIHLSGFWFKHGLGAKLGAKRLDRLAYSHEPGLPVRS